MIQKFIISVDTPRHPLPASVIKDIIQKGSTAVIDYVKVAEISQDDRSDRVQKLGDEIATVLNLKKRDGFYNTGYGRKRDNGLALTLINMVFNLLL